MKILMLSPQPFFSPRGTPIGDFYRASALCELGHEVDLLTFPIGKDVEIPGLRIFRVPGIPGIGSVGVGLSFAKIAFDLFLFAQGFFRLSSGRYDVIHANEESVFFGAAYKFFFRKVKLVYQMDSGLSQLPENFGWFGRKFFSCWLDGLESFALRRCDAVSAVCASLRDRAERLAPSVPCFQIEHSLLREIEPVRGKDEACSTAIESLRGKSVILYTGTLERYQGIPLILEAASLVAREKPGAFFVFVGGTAAQVSAFNQSVREMKLEGNVLFTGVLVSFEVRKWIERAQILVSARTAGTNVPLKIFQYLASGKPIVATRIEAHTQVVSDAEAELADANARSFASAILSVLNDPQKAARLCGAARSLYQKRYNDERYLASLREMLARVASK